jgi:hypothetical protein
MPRQAGDPFFNQLIEGGFWAMKILQSVLLAVFLASMFSAFPLVTADDPLSGTWTGDWGPTPTHRNQVTVELKWDGKSLTGNVNPGPNAVELKKATFDAKTNAIHFEADASSRRGGQIHYVIEGKLEGSKMTGSWNHDNSKGDFKITKK